MIVTVLVVVTPGFQDEPVVVTGLLAQWSDRMTTEQTTKNRTTAMLQEVVGRQQQQEYDMVDAIN